MPIVRTYLPSAFAMGQAAFTAGQGEYNKEASQFGLEVAKFGEAQRQFDVQSAQRRALAAAEIAARNERMMMELFQNQQRMGLQAATLDQRDRQFYDDLSARDYRDQQEMAFRQQANQEDWQNRFALQRQGDFADEQRMIRDQQFRMGLEEARSQTDLADSNYDVAHRTVGQQLQELRRNYSQMTPDARTLFSQIQNEYNQIGLGLPDPRTGRTPPIGRAERDQALRQISKRLEGFIRDPNSFEPEFDPSTAVIEVPGGRYVRELPEHTFIPDKPESSEGITSSVQNSAIRRLQERKKAEAEAEFKKGLMAASSLSGAALENKQKSLQRMKAAAETYTPSTEEIAAEILREKTQREQIQGMISGEEAGQPAPPMEQPVEQPQDPSMMPVSGLPEGAAFGQGTPEAPFVVPFSPTQSEVLQVLAGAMPGGLAIIETQTGARVRVILQRKPQGQVSDPFN